MRRARITVTLNDLCLNYLDNYISGKFATNRSQAIEKVVTTFFSSRITQAVILAGGKGTKMRPYTYEMPKSLLPLQGKPILLRLIDQLQKSGVKRFIICTGYLGKKIEQYFGDGKRFGVHIRYSHEEKPLFTGGPLLSVKQHLNSQPFLLVHGDIVTDLPFSDIVDFHLKEQPVVTVGLTSVEDPSKYGQLKMRGTQLVEFQDNTPKRKANSHLVNTGVYVCDPKLFEYMPNTKKAFYLEDIIRDLIVQKKANGFIFDKPWFDVGTPQSYEEAIKAYSDKKL